MRLAVFDRVSRWGWHASCRMRVMRVKMFESEGDQQRVLYQQRPRSWVLRAEKSRRTVVEQRSGVEEVGERSLVKGQACRS